MLRIINLAQWHLKKLAEGLVLKSEKVKEGRGTKNGWITSADVARLSLQELHILWPVQAPVWLCLHNASKEKWLICV